MVAGRLLLSTLAAFSTLAILLGALGLRRHSKRLETLRLVLLAGVFLFARDAYLQAAEIRAQEAIDSYDDFIAAVLSALPDPPGIPATSTTTTTTP